MTLAIGQRVIIVDGVERWREADVEGCSRRAWPDAPRHDARAVRARGGPREGAGGAPQGGQGGRGPSRERDDGQAMGAPKWVRAQGERLGLRLDSAAAAALVEQVGERQQRLLRELEKLALEGAARGPGPRWSRPRRSSSARRTRPSARLRAGRCARGPRPARRRWLYLRLRGQGERLPGLMYRWSSVCARRSRSRRGCRRGRPRRGPRGPADAAAQRSGSSRTSRARDPERLRAALGVLADLELATRGGRAARRGRREAARRRATDGSTLRRARDPVGATS